MAAVDSSTSAAVLAHSPCCSLLCLNTQQAWTPTRTCWPRQSDRRPQPGITNVDWVNVRAEDMPADLGPFRVAVLAQSFHWMNRPLVARLLHRALGADGVLVNLHATTHQGIDSDVPLPQPRPPRREIDDLVKRFLGTRRRAGQGTLPEVSISEADRGRYEAEIYRAAGFNRPTRIEVPGPIVVRSVDDIVVSVFSLSRAARTSSATAAPSSKAELRELLAHVSPEGRFSEQMRETAIDLWHV